MHLFSQWNNFLRLFKCREFLTVGVLGFVVVVVVVFPCRNFCEDRTWLKGRPVDRTCPDETADLQTIIESMESCISKSISRVTEFLGIVDPPSSSPRPTWKPYRCQFSFETHLASTLKKPWRNRRNLVFVTVFKLPILSNPWFLVFHWIRLDQNFRKKCWASKVCHSAHALLWQRRPCRGSCGFQSATSRTAWIQIWISLFLWRIPSI